MTRQLAKQSRSNIQKHQPKSFKPQNQNRKNKVNHNFLGCHSRKDNPKKPGGKEQTRCPYNQKCGACQLVEVPYEQQLKQKQTAMNRLFKSYVKPASIVGMENPYYYRNKVHAVFKKERYGTIKAGTYKEGTHEVIQIENCLIEDQKASCIIQTIYTLVKSFKYTIFDEDTLQGFFRHALIRVGKHTGEILVVLVTGQLQFPSKKHFIHALLKAHPEITSIVQSINPIHTNMILGEREIRLYGKGYIEDILCGCRFKISAKSFYQINPIQTEKLYEKAIELAGLTGKEKVIDAYCGIGTIGIIASQKSRKVWGVEVNKTAIRDANINASLNERSNISFAEADATKWLVDMAEAGKKVDVIFMDPPRAGSTKRFIEAVTELGPQRVVYISCNPETLKRDLDDFTSKNYSVKQIIPFDLFPHTSHIETCVLLSNERNQHYNISVKVDVGEEYQETNKNLEV